jgi:hypothetical protein
VAEAVGEVLNFQKKSPLSEDILTRETLSGIIRAIENVIMKSRTEKSTSRVDVDGSSFFRILTFYDTLLSETIRRNEATFCWDVIKNLGFFSEHVSIVGLDEGTSSPLYKIVDSIFESISNHSLLKCLKPIGISDAHFLSESKLKILQGIFKNGFTFVPKNPIWDFKNLDRNAIILDFIQKRDPRDFHYVRCQVESCFAQLEDIKTMGMMRDERIRVDCMRLINLISNNILVYSLTNTCGNRVGSDDTECTSHYDRRMIIRFIGYLNSCLDENTLGTILESYSSLIRFAEMDTPLISKLDIFKRFPWGGILSRIVLFGREPFNLDLLGVIVEQFLESKECVRRLINNELSVNRDMPGICAIEHAKIGRAHV